MVLNKRNTEMNDSMLQIVPSAGYTPPCDYSNFADTFDLSLLPGGDLPLSPSTQFYTETPLPKIFTSFYPDSIEQEKADNALGPDFQKLLAPEKSASASAIYLEVPSSKNYHPNSPIGALSPYSPHLLSPNEQFCGVYSDQFNPSSPDASLYNSSNNSIYSTSPRDEYLHTYIKEEHLSTSPLPNHLSPYSTYEDSYASSEKDIDNEDVFTLLGNSLLDKEIKQESTVDFDSLLPHFPTTNPLVKTQDHQLLREVLRDTSFQKKYNIKPIDFGFDIKMEEPDHISHKEFCDESLSCENIEPVLNLAIEQLRKDVDTTCTTLGIFPDPSQWTASNVLSWLQWTSREFGIPTLNQEQWDITGASLVCLSEEDFTRRSPQGGVILYAQLEIWKAAFLEENINMQWLPDTSIASTGDITDEDEEELPIAAAAPVVVAPEIKPSTSTRPTGGSHIHLWQFLKELLASPQIHGSCIRWLDRTKGVFKIEDSVKVARLWGKRKNRPAMNYDKLSRSIRQYYKKGIMKKTERSQRLVYQFCHPYCL